jgi:hypothetical protein
MGKAEGRRSFGGGLGQNAAKHGLLHVDTGGGIQSQEFLLLQGGAGGAAPGHAGHQGASLGGAPPQLDQEGGNFVPGRLGGRGRGFPGEEFLAPGQGFPGFLEKFWRRVGHGGWRVRDAGQPVQLLDQGLRLGLDCFDLGGCQGLELHLGHGEGS